MLKEVTGTSEGASLLPSNCSQPVLWHVRMEGHSIQEPVHVTVQMATVGIPVGVSTLQWLQQVMGVVCPGSICCDRI